MGNCGRRKRVIAPKVAAALVTTVIATLFVGVSWGASYAPDTDPYSLANTTLGTGVQAWWNAGYTGKGVDVALIDSGVTPVAGLDAPGKVVNGPDLSLDSQSPSLRYLDAYGHGTFMAGLIAANDPSYHGMAPDARLVSLKVGAADGAVDVSQVIAAIDWVVQHAHDPGLNIRVINLSYGTNSLQDPALDPLAYAAEQAWKHGIVVVAAGGNYGFQSQRNAPALADPAYDSSLLAVGSIDTNGTLATSDDRVPSFSPWPKRGATRGVDVVAPGAHLQGLRVPGSFVDVNHPEGYLNDRYFRGSGHVRVGGARRGRCGARPAEVSECDAGSGEAAPDGNRHVSERREVAGAGRRRAEPRRRAVGRAALRLHGVVRRQGDGLPRAGPRRGSSDRARRFGALRRAGHLRQAVRLGRHGRPRGAGVELVRRNLERVELERLELVGLELARLDLVGVKLVGVELVGVELERELVERLELERIELVELLLERLELVGRRLAGRDLGLT